MNHNKIDLKPMSLMSLILSFLSLIVISSLLFVPLEHNSRTMLITLDTIICGLFLFQLSIDFFRSKHKLQYLQDHWIDFIASIPIIEPVRYARIFHILRVFRLLRSSQSLLKQIQSNRKEATIASILILMVTLISLGSVFMLMFEGKDPNANIHTAGDAVWWAFVTISTVGYGDHYPVTFAGKVLAVLVIISGVGIFGMISGLITSIITEPSKIEKRKKEQEDRHHRDERLELLLQQQAEILKKLDQIDNKKEK
ncbi:MULTISPECIES: ion transporter [unclassified Aliivibrio]|uniref:ion transporter n=1 Tax=unclassified Aliivibrio TaxID=2645654 RepID=UPI00080DFE3B|nr:MULTISPECIES: ion transporter [unclassified Aliivibrio]OCH13243.1 capsular biosynthesis protein [Aliivibrio sp. 1S165]OCH25244.1 capsular biosynthesis protein [Aliivibrio sp. 1S128]OCH28067.1 capsular biosynthesis protein [Aliivibrio sp. 1S175]